MATSTPSLNLLRLPFSKSFSSRVQLPVVTPLKQQNDALLTCKAKKGCFNIEVVVEEDDSMDYALRHFQREVSRAGIPREWRRRMHWENAKEVRIRKAKDAARTRARERMARRGGVTRGGKVGGGKFKRRFEDEEEQEGNGSGALAKLMDENYVEGNIEVIDEYEFPYELFDSDGQGDFPVPLE